jgi:hypothetical protein
VRSDLEIPGPLDLNTVSDRFEDYLVLIYGEKGVGKTTLASQWPNSLTFMWERGRKNLPIRQLPMRNKDGSAGPPLSWDEVDKASTPFWPLLQKAVRDPSIETIIIDTVDRMYDGVFEYTCWEQGVSHPQAADEGHVVWNTIKLRFEGAIGTVLDAGKQIVLLSHAREKEILTRLGESYKIVCPTCTPTTWKSAQTLCDFVFYYGWHGKQRALKVRGDDLIVCSNQVPGHFLDPEGNPLDTIAMGEKPQDAWKLLKSAFDNQIYDITHTVDTQRTTTRRKRSTKRG